MSKLKLFIYGLIFVMVLNTAYAKIDIGKLKKIVDKTTQETKKEKDTKENQENKDKENQENKDKENQENKDKENQENKETKETQTISSWKCLGKTDKPENLVVISPDNKMMLTIDLFGKVKIYDYQTLKVKQLIQSDKYVSGVFYPNGQMVALGSKKGIAIYGIDGKMLTQCDVPAKNLSISPSGNYLAVNSGGSLTILDANTLKTVSTITSCYAESSVFFKEDFIGYISLKGKLTFYYIKEGKEVDLAQPSIDENKSIIAISDDQQLIYLGGSSKSQVIRTSDWSTSCRFDDNKTEIVAFKRNSHDIMCLNSGQKLITTYNAENGTKLGQFHDDSISVIIGFTFDQNANRLLVTASNGLFIMGGPSEPELAIDAGDETQKPRVASNALSTWKCLFKTKTTVEQVAVSSDNLLLLSIEQNGNAKIYDYTTLVQKGFIKSANGDVQTGVFYPDGKNVALGTENGIEVYSIDGKLIKKCAVPTHDLFVSHSGNYLVAKNFETLSLLDANTLKTICTIKPFPQYMSKYSFAFLKDDYLVYLSENGKLVFYNLKDGKPVDHIQPSIDEPGSLIAISDDQQLMFVGGYKKGQVLKIEDWSTLCRFNNISAKEVSFKHNSHDIMFSDNDKIRDMKATITTYNAENGTQLDQFHDQSIDINSFTTDQSGKRLLIAGSGLFIMGAPSEPEIKMADLGYRPMFVNRKTTIDTGKKSSDGIPVQPNLKIDVSNNEELHTAGYYWCKARITVDGEEKEVSGYIKKNFVSSKQTTTINDFKAYKKVLQGSYQFKDFATIMKSPASYPQCFGEYSGELVGGQIEIHKMENGTGITYLDINDYGQRFFVEIPSKEFDDDWDGMKGGGWSEGDQITLYLKFSRIGTYTNQLGMVFRIPVFRALALYDEYRVIYLKKNNKI